MTLNIGAASLDRAERILDWLQSRSDDILILTETSRGRGSALIAERLESRGYHVVWTQPEADRGVMVATRLPVQASVASVMSVTLPWRIAAVCLATERPVTVVGIYVPSRERSQRNVTKKMHFLESLLGGLRRMAPSTRDQILIAGDYNAVSRRHSPAHKGFLACEYELHDELERLGFVAGHELADFPIQPHSWIGRTGDGYLYDYFHLGRALHTRLRSCSYLHGTRESGLSDHAAVAVALG